MFTKPIAYIDYIAQCTMHYFQHARTTYHQAMLTCQIHTRYGEFLSDFLALWDPVALFFVPCVIIIINYIACSVSLIKSLKGSSTMQGDQ